MTRTALLLVHPDDHYLLPDGPLRLANFDAVHVMIADYNQPAAVIPRLRDLVSREQIDVVIYSRNDQVYRRHSIGEFIRAVPAGYSTISGIDSLYAHEQATVLLMDAQSGNGHIDWPSLSAKEPIQDKGRRGTFSLIFDTEQLGGARYGLPRILNLLHRYQVPATFFVTGFIHHTYPEILPTLSAQGHEIGIHGQFHERLAGQSLAAQRIALSAHLEEFRRHTNVTGANFIYRMDAATVQALAENGIGYFVVFAQHRYRPFAYRTVNTQPLRVCQGEHLLWLVPVPVETYTLPGWGLRPLITAALNRARADGDIHVSVLMHPFRDGTLAHINQLEQLLRILIKQHHLRPVTLRQKLNELTDASPVDDRSTRIYTHIEHIDQSYPEALTGWWSRSELYFERVSRLYQDLSTYDCRPVLSVDSQRQAAAAIYPDAPADQPFHQCMVDPLNPAHRRCPEYTTTLEAICRGDPVIFGPVSSASDGRTLFRLSIPHHINDLTAIVPETLLRIAYRLNPGHILF
ncbi:MAG: polysaccharide deacetylase family protein [Chloroflexota bacterium]